MLCDTPDAHGSLDASHDIALQYHRTHCTTLITPRHQFLGLIFISNHAGYKLKHIK